MKETIDNVIDLKHKDYYNQLLPYVEEGIEYLSGKIKNEEDSETILVIKYYINFLAKQKFSELEVKTKLKDDKLISNIYIFSVI